jgi:hypothetical protein
MTQAPHQAADDLTTSMSPSTSNTAQPQKLMIKIWKYKQTPEKFQKQQ